MNNWVLIVTNKEDVTADFVVLELTRRGWPFCRFNTEDFPNLTSAQLTVPDSSSYLQCPDEQRIALSEIQSVWFRRPRSPVLPEVLTEGNREFCERETERFLAGLYSFLDAFWVSHPHRLKEAENKPYQLKVAHALGFRVPRTVVTNDPQTVLDFYAACHGSVVAKPVRTGFIPGDCPQTVFTTLLKRSDLAGLDSLRLAPVIFQEYMRKKVDVRVTVIGSMVFAAEIHSQDHPDTIVDWRRMQDPAPAHKVHPLPPSIASLCTALVRKLGLQFGAIDLVLTPENEYVFLEINPNGQWAWIEQELGLPLTAELTNLLVHSEKR